MIHDLQVFDNPFKAHEFNSLHNCAACWGILQKVDVVIDDKKVHICQCENCGENTTGYVTKKYIARRVQANLIEAVEAKFALRDALPWMRSKKTEAELLESLGF